MQVDGFHSAEISHLSIEAISMRGKTHNIHNSFFYSKIIKALKFVTMLRQRKAIIKCERTTL